MNLILWRHAEAEDLPDDVGQRRSADLQRPLTKRGRKQAEASAKWLRKHLPSDAHIVCSPAVRARETAAALGAESEIIDELAPDSEVPAVLRAINWPQGRYETVVLVGHQPCLGRLASRLLAGTEMNWSIRKGGIWWLTGRAREDEEQVVLRAVVDSDLI